MYLGHKKPIRKDILGFQMHARVSSSLTAVDEAAFTLANIWSGPEKPANPKPV